MNSLEQIWGNLIALIVIVVFFTWIYKNMEDNSFKRWLGEKLEQMKEAFKNE